MTIGDLVLVPPVRTVIRLQDLAAGREEELLSSFVLTEEAEANLLVLLRAATGEGRGFFLQGHYGAGKSHFLTVLEILLSRPASRGAFGGELGRALGELKGAAFPVVGLSLVEHAAGETLEGIVWGEIGRKLGLHPPAGAYERREAFAFLRERIRAMGPGLFLLIDELSEFLRSKPDSRSFNEDIRFLQFLGEYGAEVPLFTVAALQEGIERTGEIAAETFKKIKDRYPVRLSLTGSHLRSLVSRRLVQKRPESEAILREVFRSLQRSQGELSFDWEEFRDLYPVHPATLRFLDRLGDLFSQHRGLVDFVHHRVRGDPDRAIPGLLREPPEHLLTPEALFDHFLDRIRESPEFNPYHDRVYRFFAEEIPQAFPAEEQADALRTVKILILAALFPHPRELSAPEVSELLLFRLTDLDPAVNREYALQILERLRSLGAYLESAEKDGETRFRLDLEADTGRLVKREVEYLKKSLFPDDRRLFERLGTWLDEPALPLGSLLLAPHTWRTVIWERTPREGLLLLRDLREIDQEAIPELDRPRSSPGFPDFVFVLAPAREVAEQKRILPELLERLGESRDRFLFWVPAPVEDPEALREALAHDLLLEERSADGSETGKRVRELLRAGEPERRARVREIFRRSYAEGELLTAAGSLSAEFPGGLPPFDEFLARLLAKHLSRLHPRHGEVLPQADFLPPRAAERLIEALGEGADLPEGRLDGTLRLVLGGYLVPLGLARRAGKGYRLAVNPTAPAVETLLQAVGEGSLDFARAHALLRDGPLGLDRGSFHLLIVSLVAAGVLVAKRRGRSVPLTQLGSVDVLYDLDRLERGEILPAESFDAIARLRFLPASLQRPEPTLAHQEEIWEYLGNWRRSTETELEELELRLRETENSPAFAGIDREAVREDIRLLREVLGALRLSYSSREGIPFFLQAVAAHPGFEEARRRLQELRELLTEDRDRLLRLYHYLTSPELRLETHPELAAQKEEILARLADPSTFLDRKSSLELLARFQEFLAAYTAEYLAAHRREVSPERFRAIETLENGPAFAALRRLGELPGINPEHDLVRFRRLLSTATARRCPRDPAPELSLGPVCACGFRLDERDLAPPVAELTAELELSLRDYLELLRSSPHAERLTAYAQGLAETGQNASLSALRRLLEAAEPAELPDLVSRDLLEILKKALGGRTAVVERDLDQLYEALRDRHFTPADLRAAFSRWLGNPPPDAFVRLVTQKSPEPPPAWTDALLEVYPEYRPALLALGADRLAFSLVAQAWAQEHGLGPEVLPGLLGFDPEPSLLGDPAEIFRTGAAFTEELVETARALFRAGRERAFREALGHPGEAEALLGLLEREEFFPELLREASLRLVRYVESEPGERRLATLARLLRARLPEGHRYLPDKEEHLRLLLRLAELSLSLAAQPPADERPAAWEEAFERNLGQLEARWEEARELRSRLFPGDEPSPRWTQHLETQRQAWEKAFRSFLPRRGDTLPAVLGRLGSLASRHEAPGRLGIFLDGARLDVWEEMMASLRDPDLPLRPVGKGFSWALSPTTTEIQLAQFDPPLHFLSPAEFLAHRPHEREGLLTAPEPVFLRLNFPDEKLHTATEPLPVLLREIRSLAESQLPPLLRAVPGRCLILLFTDHGFRENRRGSPRYLHGGDSPAEVLAPWAAFLKLA